MDPPPDPYVLLGSVAPALDTDRQSPEDGVGREQAVSTGRSSHGPWHLSRTYATQLAMSKEWLAQQGLVSFKGLWVTLAHPR